MEVENRNQVHPLPKNSRFYIVVLAMVRVLLCVFFNYSVCPKRFYCALPDKMQMNRNVTERGNGERKWGRGVCAFFFKEVKMPQSASIKWGGLPEGSFRNLKVSYYAKLISHSPD